MTTPTQGESAEKKQESIPPQKPRQFIIKQKVHLILFSDSIKSSDANTFADAAKVLKADYLAYPEYKYHSVVVEKVGSGREIVEVINASRFGDSTIISLDIISHGNQGGIHIARKLVPPQKSGLIQRNMHVMMRASSEHPQTDKDAEYIEESMHGLYNGSLGRRLVAYYYNQAEIENAEKDTEIRSISDIKFKKFSSDVFVEFHGCRTAEYIPNLNFAVDNFAKDFSDKLSAAARVVGHTVNAFPNKNPSGKSSDYRHGTVRVYKGGGDLDQDNVQRYGLKFKNSSTP